MDDNYDAYSDLPKEYTYLGQSRQRQPGDLNHEKNYQILAGESSLC